MPLLLLIFAYIAGSINFSIIIFKLTGNGDPRDAFSGNPGMTNVYRQSGLTMAGVVLLMDVGRSFLVAAMAVSMLSGGWVPWIGFALIVGNRYPCFHGFRGGKGVANYLGFSLWSVPFAVLISALSWLLCYAVVRIPFIGSFVMVSILAYASMSHCAFRPWCSAGVMVTVLFIFLSHRRNLSELVGKG
ncbi:MAG: glycerol-3-phosphate acyltransferase [Deltaproteobacteria bacterium]|nr:glycerol-3-phosphate acyltransferase [Deltaproteobacteria bacterium]